MKKQKSREPVSKLQVLQAISDKISLDIFNEIGKNLKTPDNLKQELKLTRKQYYSRGTRLLKAGLIEKKHGTYTLTSLGKVVHDAQMKIVRAAEQSWKLKVIDAIASNNTILDKEHRGIIDKLIDDPEMKKLILFKLTTKIAK